MNNDEIGKIYGNLTVLNFEAPVIYNNKNGSTTIRHIVKCVCSCGNTWIGILNSLKNGRTKSCGCLSIACVIKRNKDTAKHNLSNSPEFRTWTRMKNRCSNTKDKNYKNYGGRGITVCDRWLNSFENFYEDMGKRPSDKHSIDRIDNNLGYFPENCRWATPKEQANNRRGNKLITYKEEIKTIAQWALELGISSSIISSRLKIGWSIEKTLETPIRLKK